MHFNLPSLVFFKAGNVFSNEHNGMRFRVCTEVNSDDNKFLGAYVWPCPWNFDKTEDDKKTHAEFELSDDGIKNAKAWFQAQFEEQHDVWSTHNTGRLF